MYEEWERVGFGDMSRMAGDGIKIAILEKGQEHCRYAIAPTDRVDNYQRREDIKVPNLNNQAMTKKGKIVFIST